MVIHSAENQHLVTLSFSDISVWCYGCDDYVDNDVLYKMKNALHILDEARRPVELSESRQGKLGLLSNSLKMIFKEAAPLM